MTIFSIKNNYQLVPFKLRSNTNCWGIFSLETIHTFFTTAYIGKSSVYVLPTCVMVVRLQVYLTCGPTTLHHRAVTNENNPRSNLIIVQFSHYNEVVFNQHLYSGSLNMNLWRYLQL